MRALVTGGAGFVGSALVDRLLAEGQSVDVVDDLSTGTMLNLRDARTSGGAMSFQHLDICTSEIVDVVVRKRPDLIFHLGNSMTASSSVARPSEDAAVTLLGTLQVLAAAAAASVTKVVVALRAPDFYGALPDLRAGVTEGERGELVSPHGASSRAVVDYLRLYREREGIDFAALLVGEVYGPRERSGRTGAVRTLLDQLRSGGGGTLPGDGSARRDFVFVDDVVDALSRAATTGSGALCNVGSGVATSLAEVRALVADQLEIDRAPTFGEWPDGEVQESLLAVGHAREVLGWAPWTSLDDGVAQLIEAVVRDEVDRG